jgi:hypothetical protein
MKGKGHSGLSTERTSNLEWTMQETNHTHR